jgi:hypothetical protein
MTAPAKIRAKMPHGIPLRYGVLIGALAVAAGGYVWLWSHLAARVERDALNWANAQRAAGLTVEHGPLAVGGFPFRLTIALSKPLIADPAAGFAWSGEAASATVQPWNLRHIVFVLTGEQKVEWIESGRLRRLRGDGEAARASLVVDAQGAWQRAAIELWGYEVSGDYAAAVGKLAAHARREPRGNPRSVDLAARAEQLTVRAAPENWPLPRQFKVLNAAGAIAGAPLQGFDPAAIAAWRDAGGVVEIDQFQAAADGVELNAKGTLALDRALRPLGAMTAELKGYDKLVDALALGGYLRASEAAAAKMALHAVGKTDGDGLATISLPVSAQDGRLFLGPVPVAKLKPLFSGP